MNIRFWQKLTAAFRRPSTILLVGGRSLVVYSLGSNQPSQLNFPSEMVRNLEVMDRGKLTALLDSFFSQLPVIKAKAVVIIGDELIFQKILPAQATEAEIGKFFDQVPFDPEKMAKKQITTSQGVYLAATNKELYQLVIGQFGKRGGQVEMVLPLAVFAGIGQGGVLKQNEIKTIISNSKSVLANDFLSKPVVSVIDEEKGQKRQKGRKKLLIGVFVVLSLSALAGAGFKFDFWQQFWRNLPGILLPADVTIAPSPIATQTPPLPPSAQPSSPSATPVVIEKSQLRVQVLNGSGVAGQAARVRDILINLGFVDAQVGNAPVGSGQTTVSAGSRVTEGLVEEIVKTLGSTFVEVVGETMAEEEQFDIIITTGSEIST